MKKQLDALTSTRAIAAILVVIHHFGRTVFPFKYAPDFFHNGNLAVGYFFVLSGFVLFEVYHQQPVNYFAFLKKRMARIYPLYVVGGLLCIGVMVFDFFYSHSSIPNELPEQTAIYLLFLQSYIPKFPLAINGPGWSLSVEMLFYLLFIPLLTLLKKHIKTFLLFFITLFIISQAIHIYFHYYEDTISESVADTITFNPFIHLSQFITGMLGGFIYHKTNFNFAKNKWFSLIICMIICLVIAIRPHYLSFHAGLLDPLFMLLIISIAKRSPHILLSKYFVFLGNASYAIYILQDPVHSFAIRLNNKLHLPQFYFFYTFLFTLIIISMLAYKYFEIPLRNYINSGNDKPLNN